MLDTSPEAGSRARTPQQTRGNLQGGITISCTTVSVIASSLGLSCYCNHRNARCIHIYALQIAGRLSGRSATTPASAQHLELSQVQPRSAR